MFSRRIFCLGLTSALPLAACNSQTASTAQPVASAPAAPTVSLADFKGEWTGKSLINADLRLFVGDRVGFAYANVPTNTGEPQFIGNKMRVPFSVAGGWFEVSKKSATELNWEFSGNSTSPNKSWATLKLVSAT